MSHQMVITSFGRGCWGSVHIPTWVSSGENRFVWATSIHLPSLNWNQQVISGPVENVDLDLRAMDPSRQWRERMWHRSQWFISKQAKLNAQIRKSRCRKKKLKNILTNGWAEICFYFLAGQCLFSCPTAPQTSSLCDYVTFLVSLNQF